MKRLLITLGIALSLALIGCGGDDGDDSAKKSAGQTCTPTPEGASACASNVCLKDIQCTNGKVLNACAGKECTGGAACGGGEQCVEVTGTGVSYCVPASICQ